MTVHISFGNTCCIAYQLNKHELRNMAMPFDWILTPNIDKLLECIESSFDGFLSDMYLVSKNHSTNFPQIADDWNDDKVTTLRVINTKYKFTFVHDFTSMDDLSDVRDKYYKQIIRFHKIMLDVVITKKIYRITTNTSCEIEYKKIISVFEKLGYVNYSIHIKSYKDIGESIDWKFDHYDWNTWFLTI